jgi:hypothetical protein
MIAYSKYIITFLKYIYIYILPIEEAPKKLKKKKKKIIKEERERERGHQQSTVHRSPTINASLCVSLFLLSFFTLFPTPPSTPKAVGSFLICCKNTLFLDYI